MHACMWGKVWSWISFLPKCEMVTVGMSCANQAYAAQGIAAYLPGTLVPVVDGEGLQPSSGHDPSYCSESCPHPEPVQRSLDNECYRIIR